MRILHVTTLVTPDGRYGGPLRVALNQAAALRQRGHDVVLAAGATDFAGALPSAFAGEPVELFPVRHIPGGGFSGYHSASFVEWMIRHGRRCDVAHIHFARELMPLSAAQVLASTGVPYVAQTHGMVAESSSPLAGPLDVLATRRLLRKARSVLALTPREVGTLARVVPDLTDVEVVYNGVPPATARAEHGEDVDVLFLARLAPRKRPTDFVRMAQRLAPRFPRATFSLCGPDEGELAAVLELLRQDDAGGRIRYEGVVTPDQTEERFARAGVYVLPAEDEPFGMTVIEAMAAEVPAVVRSDCGLASFVARSGGRVADAADEESLDEAVADLLVDAVTRRAAGRHGRAAVEVEMSMGAVAARLEGLYDRAVGR